VTFLGSSTRQLNSAWNDDLSPGDPLSRRRTVRDLSDEELLAIIDRGKQAKLIEAQAVEVEPTVEPQPDVGVDVGSDT
jgi:hypothetical protein